jgi:hypothetical protein
MWNFHNCQDYFLKLVKQEFQDRCEDKSFKRLFRIWVYKFFLCSLFKALKKNWFIGRIDEKAEHENERVKNSTYSKDKYAKAWK